MESRFLSMTTTTPGSVCILPMAESNWQPKVLVEINERMRAGHMSLSNGMGVGTSDDVKGVAPNELTDSSWRDPIAGTPFHKHVLARLEAIVS